MRQEYAIITNGKVTGKAAVDTTSEPFTIPDNWIQSKKAKRGDAYDGSKFTTPAPKPEPNPIVILSYKLMRQRLVRQ